MHLLQLDDGRYDSLLEGLFELILRDLESPDPVFNLLLPDDAADNRDIAENLAGWCQGFLQGIYNDGTSAIEQSSDAARELMDDIMNIGNMDVTSIENDDRAAERSLMEIEEFLRVGIQLVYDELVSHPGPDNPSPAVQIH